MCDGLRVWKLLRRLLLERNHQADDAQAQVRPLLAGDGSGEESSPGPGATLARATSSIAAVLGALAGKRPLREATVVFSGTTLLTGMETHTARRV